MITRHSYCPQHVHSAYLHSNATITWFRGGVLYSVLFHTRTHLTAPTPVTMADIHPAAQDTKLRVPTDVTKFSGDGTTSADDFINELENWYYILSTPSHIRPRMSALFLSGAAKEWYNSDFMALPAGEQTWESFQQKLRARFARADESVMLAPLLPMSVGHYTLGARLICGAHHGASVIYICIYIVERHACEQYHKHFTIYQYIL